MFILLSARFHRSVEWILPGEGKCLRPKGNRNQPNSLSTMEHGKVEIGAEILLRIGREFGKSIEWLLTGLGSHHQRAPA